MDSQGESNHEDNHEDNAEQRDEKVEEMEELQDEYGDMVDEYGDMDEYDHMYDNQYDYEYHDDFEMSLNRAKSLENQQTNINELQKTIKEEVEEIDKYIMLGGDWAMLYYSACGWKRNLCEEFIDQNESHKKLIAYDNKFTDNYGLMGQGDCMLCCEEGRRLVRNICGDEFCEECWTGHLMERFKTYYIDPFPPCINDSCPIKVAPSICFLLGKSEPELGNKFGAILCRSYATFNNFVKVCKGREGKDCQRVFRIRRMLDVIQCDTCGSFVCPRCGEEAHGMAECYDLNNWRKITEESQEFVEFFNYKICPNCKEAVERKAGCNSIVCSCKQQFCFICGEKWLPNHKSHGDSSCYRFKEIQALKKQKEQQKQDKKAFFEKIEERKAELEKLRKSKLEAEKFRQQIPKFKQILIHHYPFYENELYFLEDLCVFQIKAQLFQIGTVISLYFAPDEVKEVQSHTLKGIINRIDDFLFHFVRIQIQCHESDSCYLSKKERDLIEEEGKQNFLKQYREFKKTSHALLEAGEKLMTFE